MQDVTSQEREVLNVPITTFSAAEGESPATILPKLIRTYPDVLVVRDLVNLETLEILVQQATEAERLVMTTLRSKDAVEALVRLLQYKIPPATLAPAMLGVLNVRLVRKLCEACREAYPPPPEVLKQMGVPAGKIEAFFRPPTEPDRSEASRRGLRPVPGNRLSGPDGNLRIAHRRRHDCAKSGHQPQAG